MSKQKNNTPPRVENRGGKRKGAGRKRDPDPTAGFTVRLTATEHAALMKAHGTLTKAIKAGMVAGDAGPEGRRCYVGTNFCDCSVPAGCFLKK